jgi:hypothetical protein
MAIGRGNFPTHGADFINHRVRVHRVLPTGSWVLS